MTTVTKLISDLTEYRGVMPYASELLGVYQPLLGWRSTRATRRFEIGSLRENEQFVQKLSSHFEGQAFVALLPPDQHLDVKVLPGRFPDNRLRNHKSILMQELATKFLPPEMPVAPDAWTQLDANITPLLNSSVRTTHIRRIFGDPPRPDHKKIAKLREQLDFESRVGGALSHLIKLSNFKILEKLFYFERTLEDALRKTGDEFISNRRGAQVDLNTVDPRNPDHIASGIISPVGIIHLFRQYFFELDTFLGPPVSHVWLAPGAEVELFEVHTRREIIEKIIETSLDIQSQSERATTSSDELSEAVKEENSQDLKLGASVQASYTNISASSSFDMSSSQTKAREKNHKQSREQTDKLSRSIRQSMKTTFKSVTDVTDLSSVRHVFKNGTGSLLNYELRQKMRQVGVQIQDVGTYLSWQTYVDDPGKELGVAELIHIASPASLESIPDPTLIPRLEAFQESRAIVIPFIPASDGADKSGEIYVDGREADGNNETLGSLELIQWQFPLRFDSPKAHHTLERIEFDARGTPTVVSHSGISAAGSGAASITLNLNFADFQGQSSITVGANLYWVPSSDANNKIDQENEKTLAKHDAAVRQANEKAYLSAVRERVTLASKIRKRRGSDLREEERIVVYRKLIQEMLLAGVPIPDERSRHLVAEMLSAIFDIDKMLYYVAPEWWKPRTHGAHRQQIEPSGSVSAATLATSKIGWGGTGALNRDNYMITEDAEPAKLGSSIGWLLQLDGDNMRNAFLNAPWVKAVIPIRPGQEAAALNWLRKVEGTNGITDTDVYRTGNTSEKFLDSERSYDGAPVFEVLGDLAERISRKHKASNIVARYPEDPTIDDRNKVNATPVDRVFEHGFNPIEGGFRVVPQGEFEVFDQWTEVLPTDQIVPVEVKYDPKTGRQV
jgi:head-tail adaptor